MLRCGQWERCEGRTPLSGELTQSEPVAGVRHSEEEDGSATVVETVVGRAPDHSPGTLHPRGVQTVAAALNAC